MTKTSIQSATSIVAVRRKFLMASTGSALSMGVFAAGTLAALEAAGATGSADSDVQIMQGALALEHEGIAAYRLAGASGLLSPGTLKVALVFKGHHEQHRDSLAALITKAGGSPVSPKSDKDYVQGLHLGDLKTEGDVVMLATRLEMGATNAYAGQVASLQDRKLTHLFTQLSSDEAVHWAVLNNALAQPVPSHAYIFG
jgi:hypothetical protein